MKNKLKFTRKIIIVSVFCLFFIILKNTCTVFAQEDFISQAKQGIVEIYSGFYSSDGVFHQMKHASGFIINNNESQAYIVTVYDVLKNTEQSKKKYCKKNDISYEDNTLDNSIQIVVKGDVMVEASVVTESEKENYSILQADSKINEKTPVRLGTNKELNIGDTVYTLGFAEDAGKYDNSTDRHTEFAAIDVKVAAGNIQDTGANKEGILYLQHSAAITTGNTGGILLDEKGYVAGLNNVRLNEDGTNVYYSLPIDNIKEILDNFEISYQSIEKITIINEYTKLLEESQKLLDSDRYKTSSKETLQEALTKGKEISLNENLDINEINDISEQIINAQSILEVKMSTSKKAVIILGIVLILTGLWLLKLIIWKIKNTKKIKDKNITEQTIIENNTIINNNETVSATKEEQPEERYQQDSVQHGYREEFISHNEDGGTVLLSSSSDYVQDNFREQSNSFYDRKSRAKIKNIRTGQVLLVEKPEIYIGKKGEMNDFVVNNNSNVSRRHACILWENQNYYIQDLQSSNGTFVNGSSIEFGNKYKLKDKDKFVLANEEFIFYETIQDINR